MDRWQRNPARPRALALQGDRHCATTLPGCSPAGDAARHPATQPQANSQCVPRARLQCGRARRGVRTPCLAPALRPQRALLSMHSPRRILLALHISQRRCQPTADHTSLASRVPFCVWQYSSQGPLHQFLSLTCSSRTHVSQCRCRPTAPVAHFLRTLRVYGRLHLGIGSRASLAAGARFVGCVER